MSSEGGSAATIAPAALLALCQRLRIATANRGARGLAAGHHKQPQQDALEHELPQEAERHRKEQPQEKEGERQAEQQVLSRGF